MLLLRGALDLQVQTVNGMSRTGCVCEDLATMGYLLASRQVIVVRCRQTRLSFYRRRPVIKISCGDK